MTFKEREKMAFIQDYLLNNKKKVVLHLVVSLFLFIFVSTQSARTLNNNIKMEAKITIFVRKSDHYNHPKGEKYNTREEHIKGDTEQEILDKFYIKNKRCDASYYFEFSDIEWGNKLKAWYKSDDYKKRSFSLYYQNSIVD